MSPPPEQSALSKYLHCLGQLFNILLIVSGVLCEILYGIDQTVPLNVINQEIKKRGKKSE